MMVERKDHPSYRMNSIALTAMAEKNGLGFVGMGDNPILPAPTSGEDAERPDEEEQSNMTMGGQSL